MSVKGFLCSILTLVLAGSAQAADGSGVTEKQFHSVIDHFLEKYKPEADRLGLKVVVNRLWSDDTVNAWMRIDNKTLAITVQGGLARHKEMTPDGLALVLCFEAAAFTGGIPKSKPGSWIVYYGQRDYYSTLKCLRRVFADDDNEAAVSALKVDPIVSRRCQREFAKRSDQLICQRSSLAGLSAALLLHSLSPDPKAPSFATPDQSEPTGESDQRISAQCRLDSYFAGALCHVDVNVPVSESDERQGVCNADEDDFGARPRCWYKPSAQMLKSQMLK